MSATADIDENTKIKKKLKQKSTILFFFSL
jgi:hypothetical protein